MDDSTYSQESLINFQSNLLRLASMAQTAQPEKQNFAKEAEAIQALSRQAASLVRRSSV